ncbi:MAG: Uma2 family endonuclease [Chloroflexi bacterium]|nr:Uma2 family endonuclease [Chloroflexota bacterium]
MPYAHEIAKLFPQQGEWSADDYFRLPHTEHIVELDEGTITVGDPLSEGDLIAVRAIHHSLKAFAGGWGIGKNVLFPRAVVLSEALIRQPDLVYIAGVGKAHLRENIVEGAPDLLVETVTPGPRSDALQERLGGYVWYGVRECWLVDVPEQTITVYSQPETTELGSTYTHVARARVGSPAYSRALSGYQIVVDTYLR